MIRRPVKFVSKAADGNEFSASTAKTNVEIASVGAGIYSISLDERTIRGLSPTEEAYQVKCYYSPTLATVRTTDFLIIDDTEYSVTGIVKDSYENRELTFEVRRVL